MAFLLNNNTTESTNNNGFQKAKKALWINFYIMGTKYKVGAFNVELDSLEAGKEPTPAQAYALQFIEFNELHFNQSVKLDIEEVCLTMEYFLYEQKNTSEKLGGSINFTKKLGE